MPAPVVVLGCPKVPPPKGLVPDVEGFGAPKRFVCPDCCAWVPCVPPNKPPADCVAVPPNTVKTSLNKKEVKSCNTHSPFVVRVVAAVAVGQKDWDLHLKLFQRDLLQAALAESVAERRIGRNRNRWLCRLAGWADQIWKASEQFHLQGNIYERSLNRDEPVLPKAVEVCCC